MRSFTPAVKAELQRCGCYFTVDGKILSRHTANAVMKQAGLAHQFR